MTRRGGSAASCPDTATLAVPDDFCDGRVLVSTLPDRADGARLGEALSLGGDEGVIAAR